jgi:uncharacterized protein YndB with AHSA1/START domain
MDNPGQVEIEEGRGRVTFERELEATIDRVWAAISTSAGLTSWLAPAEVELSSDGRIDLDFGEGGVAGGKIIDIKPGTMLEFEWRFPGEHNSVLRLELEDLGSERTRMVLDHRLVPGDQTIGYGAGWHAYLDHLAAVLGGRDPGPWSERFDELLPSYQAAQAG